MLQETSIKVKVKAVGVLGKTRGGLNPTYNLFCKSKTSLTCAKGTIQIYMMGDDVSPSEQPICVVDLPEEACPLLDEGGEAEIFFGSFSKEVFG